MRCPWPVVFAAFVIACGADTEPEPPTERAACARDVAVGVEVGMLVPSIEIRRCDGSTVDLRELVCGRRLTLLDIGSAAFAPCIEATRSYARDERYDALQAAGLNIVQVFTTDAEFQPASNAFCEEYIARHAVDFEFLVDPTFESDVFSLPHPLNVVIDARGVIIQVWNGTLPEGRVDTLEALLDEAS